MHILLINHYAGSPRHGMEYRPYYLAREWVQMGHQVTILASSYSHVRTVSPDISVQQKNPPLTLPLKGEEIIISKFTEEWIDGIRYIWIKTPSYSGNGVRRAINIFSFVFNIYRFSGILSKICQPDVVITSSTHPLDNYPAYALAKKNHAKLIFEVHDLWPLSLLELGGMSRRHPFIIFLQWAENFAYRHADRVVSMLPSTENYMAEHGMASAKFSHIPNGIVINEWLNESAALPEEHRMVINRCKQEGKFLVGYAGAHGIANGLHSLVEAGSLLAGSPVEIVLIGQGPEKEKLQQLTERLGTKNISFLPPVCRDGVPAFLQALDVCFISLQNQPLFRFGISPNKLFDYMMAAKPVIQAINVNKDIVKEAGCGITISPEKPQEIADAIKKMMMLSPDDREKMGQSGREYVIEHHNYHHLAQQFLAIME